MYIVDDIAKCGKCDKLLCAGCIEEYSKHSNECPLCRKRFVASKETKSANEFLGNILFKCKKCDQDYPYKERKEHWHKPIFLDSCPYGCKSIEGTFNRF